MHRSAGVVSHMDSEMATAKRVRNGGNIAAKRKATAVSQQIPLRSFPKTSCSTLVLGRCWKRVLAHYLVVHMPRHAAPRIAGDRIA